MEVAGRKSIPYEPDKWLAAYLLNLSIAQNVPQNKWGITFGWVPWSCSSVDSQENHPAATHPVHTLYLRSDK